MDLWIEKNFPITFWISGFFFTQAFLTGVKQNMARQDKVPIDMIEWNYFPETRDTLEACVKDQYENSYSRPQKGCYIFGLYMEGARYCDETKVVAESKPKVLFDTIPVIFMKPVMREDDETPLRHLKCPVYKTSERRGVLSTTGHSTNFVMTMILSIADIHTDKYWVRRGVAMLTQLDE